MEHLTIMIKPASSLCNMRCRYCFYHDIAGNRNNESYGIMKNETARIIILESFKAASRSVSFVFQGGEPTLAGLEFFKYFVKTVKELNAESRDIFFSLQTNGLAVNEEFAVFFAENNFLVGLSLDGYKEIHDFLRPDVKNNPTHKQVLNTAKLFNKFKVEYNILTVVTAYTVKHIEKIYGYFKSSGLSYLQFIPCLDPLGNEPFGQPHSLTPKLYEGFLIKLFNLYYHDFMNADYVSIRFFDNLVNTAAGKPAEQCGMLGYCPGQLVVEADGTVFPCDFYCVDYWQLGNIHNQPIDELGKSEKMAEFRKTSLYDTVKCQACDVYPLCRGGCRRDRDSQLAGRASENIYCEALYHFLTYAKPFILHMVEKLRTQG